MLWLETVFFPPTRSVVVVECSVSFRLVGAGSKFKYDLLPPSSLYVMAPQKASLQTACRKVKAGTVYSSFYPTAACMAVMLWGFIVHAITLMGALKVVRMAALPNKFTSMSFTTCLEVETAVASTSILVPVIFIVGGVLPGASVLV